MNLDSVYKWATLLIIPFYVISTSIRSEIFILYAFLFVLKVRKHGYQKNGLEWFALAAVIGLAISYIGVWESSVLKNVSQVARIIVLPLLMSQFRPIPKLDYALATIFSGLSIYGVIRMAFFPLVTGYALDRPYCFSDFFMHSSLISVSGYLFFLVMLVRKPDFRWKALSVVGAAVYLYLIAIQNARASYLSVLLLTPLLLMIELRKVHWLHWLLACLMLGGVIGLFGILQPAVIRSAANRALTIVDTHDGSNRGRLVIWTRALEVFREHPINGIGYRRFNRHFERLDNEEFEWSFAHAHNETLGMLAETGVIGAFAWLAFKCRLFFLFFRDRRKWIAAFLLYLFLAFEIHNFFEIYLYERIAYIYIYLLFGLGLRPLLAAQDPLVDNNEVHP